MTAPSYVPDLSRYRLAITQLKTTRTSGRVVQVVGLTIQAVGLDCQIGEICEIQTEGVALLSEVVGFQEVFQHRVGQLDILDAGLRPAFERLAVPRGPRRVLVQRQHHFA